MPLDALLTSLNSDVEDDARRIVDAAAAEAGLIRADAQSRAAQRCAEALAAREGALRASMDARRAQVRRESRIAVLQARQRFLDRTFAAVEQGLVGALDTPQRADALAGLVSEALEFFPSVPAVIRCRAGLAERAAPLAESLGVRVSSDDSVPEGVIVDAADGSAAVNNTLIERLRRRRPQLSIALLSRAGATP